MGRAPCCDKANVKRGPWSPEEDAKLKDYMKQYGTGGNWITLPQKIGLKRCGKSCRLRWMNYLRPNIKHGGFSEEEDNIICSLYSSIGSRWSIIANQLPGRTDNDIKNYWNTKLKKKLLLDDNQRNLPKEIMKMETTCRSLMANNPECVIPYPNHQISSFEEQQKSAVIKSEGIYSDQQNYNNNWISESKYQYPIAMFSTQQHYHRNAINPIAALDPQQNGLDFASIFDGIYNFSNADYRELEGLNDSKQGLQINGLESFYGMDAMSSGSMRIGASSIDAQGFGHV